MLRPVLLAACALLAASAAAQPSALAWAELEFSPYHEYRTEDVAFAGPDHGWAVNGSGEVWRTTDGGDSWSLTTQLAGYLRSTAFASREVGWIGVLGSSTRLYETRDGGLTFQNVTGRIQPALLGGICSLHAVSESVVYGAGQYNGPATIIKTADGGRTWTSRSLAGYLNTVIDVYFFDEQRGLAVGGVGTFGSADIQPRVIGTEDGGATWTVRHTAGAAPAWGWKLSFPTPDVGYASVEKPNGTSEALVLKTTDGGRTWRELPVPNAGTGSMQAVGFLTPDVGWVSGRGTVSMTTDGGETWTQPAGLLDGNVNRFRFLDGGLGYAAGQRIYRLDARATPAAAGPDAAWGLEAPHPNPARSSARIAYRLGAPGPVRLEVVDVLGRTAATLVDGVEAAGAHAVDWPVGADRAAGLYLVRLEAGGRVATRRLVVAR